MPRVTELKPKYMSNQIGKEIDAKRVFRRMSQRELADHLGTTQQNINKKLNGKGKFNYEELIRAFDVLKLTDEEILRLMKL